MHKGKLSKLQQRWLSFVPGSDKRKQGVTTSLVLETRVQKRENNSGAYVCLVPSHFGTFLTVGAMVQVHSQFGCLDMSVNLPFPVVDQGGRTDDQGAFRNDNAGVWMTTNKQINHNLHTLNTQHKISPPEFRKKKKKKNR